MKYCSEFILFHEFFLYLFWKVTLNSQVSNSFLFDGRVLFSTKMGQILPDGVIVFCYLLLSESQTRIISQILSIEVPIVKSSSFHRTKSYFHWLIKLVKEDTW